MMFHVGASPRTKQRKLVAGSPPAVAFRQPPGGILIARMKVIVIIPAAGLGTRMASVPAGKAAKPAASKQFLELDGVPVLVHTLRAFAKSAEVNQIIIASRKPEMDAFRERMAKDAPEVLKRNPIFVEG